MPHASRMFAESKAFVISGLECAAFKIKFKNNLAYDALHVLRTAVPGYELCRKHSTTEHL